MSQHAWNDVLEEIKSIQSIFCAESEAVCHGPDEEYGACGGYGVRGSPSKVDAPHSLRLDLDCDNINYSVHCTIPVGYPFGFLKWKIICERMSKDSHKLLLKRLTEHMKSYYGLPRLMEAILFIQDQLRANPDTFFDLKPEEAECIAGTSSGINDRHKEDLEVSLLKLDHMRDRKRYSKTVTNWAEQLAISGYVILYLKLRFIIVQGTRDAVKEFLKRMRTHNVDVDSKGRPCRERMMDVLTQTPLRERTVQGFSVVDSDDRWTVEELFEKARLEDFVKELVADRNLPSLNSYDHLRKV